MPPRTSDRLDHILTCIGQTRSLLQGKSLEAIGHEPATILALERLMEIISEASRHIPDDYKVTYGKDINWRALADLGNVLRHAYHLSDVPTLWRIYEKDIGPLEVAVKAMQRARPGKA